MEIIRSVFVPFHTPRAHRSRNTNVHGPIIGIEIKTTLEVEDGKIYITSYYIAKDGLSSKDDGPMSFMALTDLCRAYDFNLNEVVDLIARAFVEKAGTTL